MSKAKCKRCGSIRDILSLVDIKVWEDGYLGDNYFVGYICPDCNCFTKKEDIELIEEDMGKHKPCPHCRCNK